jgi:retinol dehydrogenase-14
MGDASLQGRTALVTGGNAGIGLATACALAARGAHVVLLGRNPERNGYAAAEIREATGSDAVTTLACDLTDPSAVRWAADRFRRDHATLDVLINNAGIFLPTRELTPTGLEKTFAGIYLGHFLLTNLLLDALKAAPEGRVVCVTCPPKRAKVHFDDLRLSKKYSTLIAQFQAKGALFMFARELTRRLEGSAVTVNTVLPGLMIKTELFSRMPFYMRAAVALFGTTVDEGADAEVWLATAPELKGVSGRYFYKRQEQPLRGQITDDDACRKLWDLSVRLAGL